MHLALLNGSFVIEIKDQQGNVTEHLVAGSVVIATKRNQMFRLVGSFVTKPRTKKFSF